MSGKYLAAREAFGEGALSWTRDRIVAQLVSAAYVFNELHAAAGDLAGQVGEPIELTEKSMTGGWAGAAKMVFPQVSGAEVVAVVFYRQPAGKKQASTLIACMDSVDNFPMTPNGGDIEIDIAGAGIFRL